MTTATKKTAPKKKSSRSPKNKPRSTASSSVRRKTPDKARSSAPQHSMMRTLRAEHSHIATVLNLFSEQLDALDAGEFVDSHVIYEIMDYITNWPDQFHHPREDIIYSRVAEISPNAADEVDTLQRDHDASAKRGKALLKTIADWRENKVDAATVVKQGRGYISHTFEHMNIEEKVVFPHIEAQLTQEDWRELEQEDVLQAVSKPVFGAAVQREYRGLTRKLRRSLRRKVEEGALTEWVSFEALMETAEVLSLAYECARDSTVSHLRTAMRESWDLARSAPIQAPIKCTLNNARVTIDLLGEMAQISTETVDDLQRVNQARRERLKLLANVAAKP